MGQSRRFGSLAVKIIATAAAILLLLTTVGSLVRIAPSALAPIFGPERIEREEAGFAISLPRDWEYRDATASYDDWWDPDYGTPTEQHEGFLELGGVLLARSGGGLLAGHHDCRIYRWSGADAQDYVNSVDDDPRALAVESVSVTLPGGRAVAYDMLYDDGRDWRDYLVTDGQRWITLMCGSTLPPRDRWFSIAETIEFLLEVD